MTASATWVDVSKLRSQLDTFFGHKKRDINRFGSTVNQTFEAFVLAQVVEWYRSQPNYTVHVVGPKRRKSRTQRSRQSAQPGPPTFRLKFSTRGRPANYSYVLCVGPTGEAFQIRHQLRVATRHHKEGVLPRANVCLDVATIRDRDLDDYSSSDHVPNEDLITFGEAKHMSAFAELVAGFIGLVHEMQPNRLRRTWNQKRASQAHPSPFLFVSGHLWATAEGMEATIKRRRLDIDIYSKTKLLAQGLSLPTKPAGRTA
jgi:hypothetical protein